MNPEDMIAKLSYQMSPRRRIANVIALLGGLTTAAVVGLLWVTEPGLPPRTELAFGALVVIGLAWAVYGVWALNRRTPLFALDRVIAAWIAVAVVSFLAVTACAITIVRDRVEPVLVITVAALIALAMANLVRARKHRAALLRRKHELGG